MKVAIHQPNFAPWIGYFSKIAASDIFILLDDAQYTKNSYINRNRIRIGDSSHWLTIPVRTSRDLPINQVEIDNKQNWKSNHLKTLKQYYGKSAGYARTMKMIEDVYSVNYKYIHELNTDLIMRICSELGLYPELRTASELGASGKSTSRLIELVRQVGGDTYVSGHGAEAYQDESLFMKNDICLKFLEVDQVIYPQQGNEFISSLSVIDYLFNVSAASTDILSYRVTEKSKVQK